MKLLILILFLPSLLLSSDFSKISSVNFDLVGVVASGDKIAAYGTNGSVYYSEDDAQSWSVIKPFETGNIINFFIESDRLIAFLQTGEVSQSYDNGLNWSVTNPIIDSVSYVIKGNDDYYLRTKELLIKLSSNLTLSNSYQYPYYVELDITNHYVPANRRKMAFLDNKLFVLDLYSSGFIIFDSDLNRIDSVNVGEKILKSNIYISNVINDTKELVIKLTNYNTDSTYFCRLNTDMTELKVILNYSDKENNKKIFKENSFNIWNFNLYNDKLYTFSFFSDENHLTPYYNVYEVISKDSAIYKGLMDATVGILGNASRFKIADFVIENDRITGVSKNNLIVTKKINSESSVKISNLFGSGNSANLFQINASEFILFASKNIYRSKDTAKTFTNVEADTSVFSSYYNFNIRFNYFDEEAKRILYFAYSMNADHIKDPPFVLISENYGDSFTRKQLEGISINNLANSYSISHIKNNYLISETNFGVNKVNYFIYDENFNLKDSILDSQYLFSNLFGSDLIEFTFLGRSSDFENNNQYLKSTSDGGETWNDIRTFGFSTDTILYNDSINYYTTIVNDLKYNKKLEVTGKDYLLLVTYNRLDSIYKVEAMDIQTNEFSLIYQNKQDTYSNILVELIDGVYFICKDDTLFTTTNLFDYNSWKGQKLPNNGTMTYKIMKSGDYLITYYYDDIHPYDIYRIKWNELTTTGISENDIETYTYFYNSPPFPQPMNNIVTTEVYLDQGISLSKDGIKVFDMNGTQVEKGDNIEVTGTNWPTTLKWDSSNQPPGVYFIVIDYGENTRAIKVIKE